jgi:hypothetical protein
VSLLAAVLIVRDEATSLPACLSSLDGVVDEVHVYDTGSVDGTAEVATGHGARLVRGRWSDDFAAARNAAAEACDAEWILAIDADHRVTAHADLRRFLGSCRASAAAVEVHDLHHAGSYRQFETRLYRPAAVSWSGRAHERLTGAGLSLASVPSPVFALRHLGHVTHAERVRRAVRNMSLTQLMLDEVDRGDRPRIAYVLLSLGRDCAAAERWQQAVDTFEMVRELFPGTQEWVEATDALARIMLASCYDKVCLVLVEQLREAGAPASYCDWLAAQALAQLGDPQEAARLLAGITDIVDTTGRRHGRANLKELTALVERLRTLTAVGR